MNSQKPQSSIQRKRITKADYRKSKSKKIIIAVFCAIIVSIILCYAIMGMISQYGEKEDENSTGTLIFYEADPDKNIFNDQNYLDLDRNIRFENTSNGITVAITQDDLGEVPTEQRKYVAVVCEFINHAIHGEHEALNDMFSEQYIAAGGELKLKFTMQQLYDIKISYVGTSSYEEDDKTVTYYDYWLEYKIRQNNGTFRYDMESDCSRKEYIRISNRNEEYKIDVLSPYKSVEYYEPPISQGTITALVVLTAVLMVSIVAILVYFTIKSKKKNTK